MSLKLLTVVKLACPLSAHLKSKLEHERAANLAGTIATFLIAT